MLRFSGAKSKHLPLLLEKSKAGTFLGVIMAPIQSEFYAYLSGNNFLEIRGDPSGHVKRAPEKLLLLLDAERSGG